MALRGQDDGEPRNKDGKRRGEPKGGSRRSENDAGRENVEEENRNKQEKKMFDKW